MIDRVRFRNFMSLADVDVDLERLTVLVGPNGAGKSSVLRGLHLLGRCCAPSEAESLSPWLRFSTVFAGPDAPHRLATAAEAGPLTLAMRARGGEELTLQVDGLSPAPDAARGSPEGGVRFELTVRGQGPDLAVTLPNAGTGNPLLALGDERVRRFASTVVLRLETSRLSAPSRSVEAVPRIAPDGYGLASTLAWMKGAAEEEIEAIRRDLAAVVPGVERIRTARVTGSERSFEQLTVDGQPLWRPVQETVVMDRFELEFEGGRRVPADLLSEGTVVALGLLAKLREPGRPRLVMLDDIDRGLHIGAQARLVGVLRALLDADPALQIVCTTHSPYLLDLFRPEEVRVLTLDAQRNTRLRGLTDHPDFERLRHGHQTGELWASWGESWVVGG